MCGCQADDDDEEEEEEEKEEIEEEDGNDIRVGSSHPPGVLAIDCWR